MKAIRFFLVAIVATVLISISFSSDAAAQGRGGKGGGKMGGGGNPGLGSSMRMSPGGSNFNPGQSIKSSIGNQRNLTPRTTQINPQKILPNQTMKFNPNPGSSARTTLPKQSINPNLVNKLKTGSIPKAVVKPGLGTANPSVGNPGLGSIGSGGRSGHPVLRHAISHHPYATGCLAGLHFASHHCHAPLTHYWWNHYYPTTCHWWWNYCPAIQVCVPTSYYYWNWYYVTCPQVVNGVPVQQQVDWYLGLSGMLLPNSGLGIDAVAAASPAELAGLKPGMVITSVNGIAMVDEASMQSAIAASGGVLNMQVVSDQGQEPIAVTVQMKLVAKVNF